MLMIVNSYVLILMVPISVVAEKDLLVLDHSAHVSQSHMIIT